MKKLFSILLTGLLLATPSIVRPQVFTDQMKSDECKKIKAAALYAWNGYKQYAWGYDALRPLSKQGRNWYGTSLCMTPLDAFDTFILMGMTREARDAKTQVLTTLNFDSDQEIQVFEVSIRLLGGLLSAYEMDGDRRFLALARDLGNRLLPAFSSPTGMPYRFVNLKTGMTRDEKSNPAEIGTYLLEFGKLTQYSGDSIYYKTAKKAAFEVYKRRSRIGLVGTVIDVNTGNWLNTESQIGARVDSYYEYLFKCWLLFGDRECKEAWETHKVAILKYLVRETPRGDYLTRVDMNTGQETRPFYGALDAFFAGTLCLSGDVDEARKIQKANYSMWTRYGIEPEEFNFREDTLVYPSYPLRPENLESCFYLYRATNEEDYLLEGKRMIGDILDKCRNDAGFASLKNVKTGEQDDEMESFFFAETLKYAYLIFAPENLVNLEQVVFTTEAHPLLIKKKLL